MEWTREKTLQLISEYRKRRGLWDMTHDDYRKKEFKQKLLVEVSECIGGGIPIVEVEKKFHTLRTQYHREINRMKRKEPYNSKWFGFKYLQFLSSPKACRSSKGRTKNEITEEGTVTPKYIIREAQPNDNSGSVNTEISEEFITIHRKPFDGNEVSAASTSRSQELEKLIEETTKDVDEIEEVKPKMTIKQITLPINNYSNQLQPSTVTAEIVNSEDHQQEMHEEEEQMETIDIQSSEHEIQYQSSTNGGISNEHNHVNASMHHHHQNAIPARIIKIQRRETSHDEEFFEEDPQKHVQSQQHHNQTVSANTAKRIYYDTILTTSNVTPQLQQQPQGTVTNSIPLHHIPNHSNKISTSPSIQSPHQLRDEFLTYGEYVANEMRCISDREILTALKHKINTALYEAGMAQLRK